MSVLLPFLASLLAGILAAWGVGGGTLLLLVMTLLLDVPQQTAQGINLLFFLPCAAVALRSYHRKGYLQPRLLRLLIPSGVIAAAAASWLLHFVDTDTLRRPFGLLLLWAAIALLREGTPRQD